MPVPWPRVERVTVGIRQHCTDHAGAEYLATKSSQVRSSLLRRGPALFPRREAVRETVRAWLTHRDHDPLPPEARGRLLRMPAMTSAASGHVHRASVPRRFIHHIAQRLAGREPAGVVEQDLKPTLRDIVRVAHGNMRRQ